MCIKASLLFAFMQQPDIRPITMLDHLFSSLGAPTHTESRDIEPEYADQAGCDRQDTALS
jgi:hypothetical protein